MKSNYLGNEAAWNTVNGCIGTLTGSQLILEGDFFFFCESQLNYNKTEGIFFFFPATNILPRNTLFTYFICLLWNEVYDWSDLSIHILVESFIKPSFQVFSMIPALSSIYHWSVTHRSSDEALGHNSWEMRVSFPQSLSWPHSPSPIHPPLSLWAAFSCQA